MCAFSLILVGKVVNGKICEFVCCIEFKYNAAMMLACCNATILLAGIVVFNLPKSLITGFTVVFEFSPQQNRLGDVFENFVVFELFSVFTLFTPSSCLISIFLKCCNEDWKMHL